MGKRTGNARAGDSRFFLPLEGSSFSSNISVHAFKESLSGDSADDDGIREDGIQGEREREQ
jgi:hypothetical protein